MPKNDVTHSAPDSSRRTAKKSKTTASTPPKPPDPGPASQPVVLETSPNPQSSLEPSTPLSLLASYQAIYDTVNAIPTDDIHKRLALAQLEGLLTGAQAMMTLLSATSSPSNNPCQPPLAVSSSQVSPPSMSLPTYATVTAKRPKNTTPTPQAQATFRQHKKEAIENLQRQFGKVDYNIDLQFTLEPAEDKFRHDHIPPLLFQRELEGFLTDSCKQPIKINKIWRLPRGGFTIQVPANHVEVVTTWSNLTPAVLFSSWQSWTIGKRPKPPYPDCEQVVIYDVDPQLPDDVLRTELIHHNSSIHQLDPDQCQDSIKEVHRLNRWNPIKKCYEPSRAVKVTLAPALARPLLHASALYLGSQIHYVRRFEKQNLKCFRCGRSGHVSLYCRSQPPPQDWADTMDADPQPLSNE